MLNEKAAEILNSALIPFSRVLDIFISKYMTDNKIAAILASPKINISLAARLLGRSNRISIERIRIILTDPVMPIKRARQIVENENMPKEKRGKLSF
jgi:hypothetical protein